MSMHGTSILSRIDEKAIGIARSARMPALRLGLAVVYLWFGAIKLIPGGSPIEALAVRTVSALTFGVVTGDAARITAGVSELVIGVVLVSMRIPRITALLLLAHVVMTTSPLVLFGGQMWRGMLLPTLEAQYMIKNTIIVGAAVVIAATAATRGRRASGAVPQPRVHHEVPAADRVGA